jgi:hypothetical protein
MKRYIFFLSLLVVLTACEKTIDLPIEYTEPKLVVNSITSPDSLWSVHLSASKYIYETSAIPLISDATISLQEIGGDSIALIPKGNGLYVAQSEKPISGRSYTLSVNHPNFEAVSGQVSIPSSIGLSGIQKMENVIVQDYTYTKIRITFDDPPGQNFYRISFFQSGLGYDWNSSAQEITWIEYPFWVSYQDPNSNSVDGSLIGMETLLLSDEFFDGKEYSLDILVDSYYFDQYQSEYDQFFKVKLHHVSKDYYWFAVSLESYYEGSDFDFFTQPVQVYTNIENGLGIFASYQSAVDSIFMIEGKPFSK